MNSKFDQLLKSVGREVKAPKTAQPRKTRKAPAKVVPAQPPQRGRPRAKHSDPDYTQVTAYIRKATHKDVKIALVHEEQEFSELVEQLLADWLKLRG